MCDLKELNFKLEELVEGKILDAGNLDKPEAMALRDIFEKRYFIYGPNKDEYNFGKYALGFQKKYFGGKVNA